VTALATARLRLLRWRLTALYTLVSAVCLVVVASSAGVVDSHSRASALDAEVGRSVTALSHAVYYDQGTLHLESLRDDVLAASPTQVYVVEWGANGALVPRYGSARDTWLPDPDSLRQAADETRHDQDTVLLDGTGTDGRPLRLAGAPVWNGGQIAATVIAAGDPADGAADHTTLLRDLALVCFILLLSAAAAGHFLSGRRMRTALSRLDQQERFLTQVAERAPLRLDLLVEQLVENLDRGAEVSVMASPCVVSGDPELLSRAIRNLLDNAVRHGGESAIEVVVGEGRITVKDHGPGIPEADRERMFGGAGTGLAIVRWVADLHGGSARLLGDEDGGTVGELVLPTTDPSGPP
jgi:two-component system OmpR family sensor kinase